MLMTHVSLAACTRNEAKVFSIQQCLGGYKGKISSYKIGDVLTSKSKLWIIRLK